MYKKFHIESRPASLRIVENAIDQATGELKISQDLYGKILVSTIEAVNNAIIHGNRSDPSKFVDIEILYKEGEIKIIISDQGNGFIPSEIPDPTIPENIEVLNGRGVFLMSRLADKIEYNKRGNEVSMTFKNIVT